MDLSRKQRGLIEGTTQDDAVEYYEVAGNDDTFGIFSIAGIVTVPLGPTTRYGAWNVHGGVEFQQLGDNTAFFNGGDHTRMIGSIGLGFSY